MATTDGAFITGFDMQSYQEGGDFFRSLETITERERVRENFRELY